MNWIYYLSLALLWIATGANVCSLIRSIRSHKRWEKTYDELFSELRDSITKANNAEKIFLEAAKTYRKMTDSLCTDQEKQEELTHDGV